MIPRRNGGGGGGQISGNMGNVEVANDNNLMEE